MLILLFVALALTVTAFVSLRRQRAKQWDPSQPISTPGETAAVFERVWLHTTPPRGSFWAHGNRRVGTLAVDLVGRRAAFKDTGDPIDFGTVLDVKMGRRGSDFVNTWVEVSLASPSELHVVYLNDGAWLGWRPLLTDANVRIAAALSALMPKSPHETREQ